MWHEFDNESQIMSDNVGYWGKRCSTRRSLTQFQSFLLVLLELERRWACGEMSLHLFYLDVLLNQSVYPNDQRKSVYRPSWLIVIRFSAFNITFVMKMVICSLDTSSKKSSRFRNACRASDWWYHLISSSRFQYPNKTRRKTRKPLPGMTTSD